MVFSCERCGYVSAYKCNILNHLSKKKICSSLKNDISRDKCLDQLSIKENNNIKFINNKFSNTTNEVGNTKSNTKVTQKTTEKNIPKSPELKCEFCEKEFNLTNSYYRHRKHYCKKRKENEDNKDLENKLCEMNERMEEMKEINMEMKSEIRRLQDNIKNSGPTNINNIHIENKNNTIIINKYGNENMECINGDFINHLGNRTLYTIPAEIAKRIHINPKYPENCNIKIRSTRSDVISIFNGIKWIKMRKSNMINRILADKMDIFLDNYSGNRKMTEEFIKKYDKNDKSTIKALKDNLELIFVNNYDDIKTICENKEDYKEI